MSSKAVYIMWDESTLCGMAYSDFFDTVTGKWYVSASVHSL